MSRNSPWCSIKKATLKNFAMFIGKNLSWSLFLMKLFQHSFPVNNVKFLKILLLGDHLRRLLLPSQDATHKNTLKQLHAKGSLFYRKYSQWGNRFLLITGAYLKPSRKSTMELFCKNS